MTYAESIEFLYSLRLFGLKLGLENTRQLAALVGNPQDQLRFIHIAGTNGKGSVAAMLESIYRVAGLRVGLYTSPHLVSFRERIQVNRQMISEADVVRLVAELRRTGVPPVIKPAEERSHPSPPGHIAAVQRENEDRRDACPTFFEFVTVMALRYFAEQKCDLVIWETGLGGRLDATNIVTPLASVITNIEYDHQHWLGHDLRSIATEKAGIIKPGVPVITATAEPEALAVIQETALARGSALIWVTPAQATAPPLDRIKSPLLGWHQQMNAATTLAVVRTLASQVPLDESALLRGLQTVSWPGRLQLIEQADGRRLLLDGAHNAAGAASLRAVLEQQFPGARPALILGILHDKDWQQMCEILAPLAGEIHCVPVKSEHSATPDDLAAGCRRTNPTVSIQCCGALAQALEATASAPFVLIAGSLYLVGEAMELLQVQPGAVHDEKALNEWR